LVRDPRVLEKILAQFAPAPAPLAAPFLSTVIRVVLRMISSWHLWKSPFIFRISDSWHGKPGGF
jgi:hypothetical protein